MASTNACVSLARHHITLTFFDFMPNLLALHTSYYVNNRWHLTYHIQFNFNKLILTRLMLLHFLFLGSAALFPDAVGCWMHGHIMEIRHE